MINDIKEYKYSTETFAAIEFCRRVIRCKCDNDVEARKLINIIDEKWEGSVVKIASEYSDDEASEIVAE